MPALATRSALANETGSAPEAFLQQKHVAVRPAGHRFNADVEVSEIDERTRPGPSWVARSLELSRSHVVMESRRMCYPGRVLALAVHLIDDRPVPLLGRVVTCQYSDDGLYRVDLDLIKIPEGHSVYAWAVARSGPVHKRT
ncbi:MAG: hypothetical protein KF691_09690 [Phycisphaeraceae bacterium]|nr:hypothetical protein [Phycisphaeraceae bacterium]